MFRVKSKNTRTTSNFSSVSIIGFEQVNVSWAQGFLFIIAKKEHLQFDLLKQRAYFKYF